MAINQWQERSARKPNQEDLNLLYLQSELARIDILIHREVRRCQLANQDIQDAYRGLYISDNQADQLLKRPFAASWGQTVQPEEEEEQYFQQALFEAGQRSEKLRVAAHSQGESLRLDRLAAAFQLDRFEIDALLVCLAPNLDLRYERLYGYLQDDVTRRLPSINLVLDLLCPCGTDRLLRLNYFSESATFIRFDLLKSSPEPGGIQSPLLARTLVVDETIVHWLLGNYHPDPDLSPYLHLSLPKSEPEEALLASSLRSYLISQMGPYSLLAFYGPDSLAQEAAAQYCAAHFQIPLLRLDLAPLAAAEQLPPDQAVRMALRDARLTGAILLITHWESCLEDDLAPARLLAELYRHPGPLLLASRTAWHAGGLERKRRIAWIEFPLPGYTQRRGLWDHYLSLHSAGDLHLDAVAGQFMLSAGQIRDAVAAACDCLPEQGRPLTERDLFTAARLLSTPHLKSLAQRITPRYGWEDIVLPEDQVTLLKEIVATVRCRPVVLDAWGVGCKLASSRGLSILFAGPPGTGKTMAAEVIAGELGMDLFRIDLSSLVSKYIGETEKHLAKVFDEAQNSNAILFFDEADALFGKRSEVRDSHDRYANIEISYLLQRMESYDGVTILATNLRANLDEAFTRRLQFVVDFPFPDETYRLRIWQALFPTSVPSDFDLDFDLLSQRYKLAGGNIRNILINAAYLAAADGGSVRMEHLLHSARRELQKIGKIVDEKA